MNAEYIQKRKQFYSRISNFWADLYGDEYALYDVRMVNHAQVEKIRMISKYVSTIFHKTAHLLRNADDETLLELGFSKSTLPFIRLQTNNAETVISRLDLVEVDGTYKVLELNADTPTFIKELFYVNKKVCEEFRVVDPNDCEEEILSKVVTSSIMKACTNCNDPYVVFTSHEHNIEDQYTSMYLQSVANLKSTYVPLSKLQIDKEGLYDPNGRKIDVLYRQTFPIEQLILDRGERGEKIGEMLLDLVLNQKLGIVNPPSAFLLQSKVVQAAIWGLHEENNAFFSQEEHTWIEEYFLPTFLEKDRFVEEGHKYVKKPAFGREGDTIEIYNSNGELLFEDKSKSYTEYTPVYQKFVELPMCTFPSVRGKQRGHVMIGSFLLNGEPSAIGFRVGNPITDNLSYYLPIGLE
ncbi:glutathionylspermidine synthase family protein [Bacillus spongiae]|uniref:Glutathionylspermidine synthase family protein n=1 Tax=Bacillus spongiae TaxID=2683610 RepID=A0ABU8HED4_9BACI